MIHQFITIKGTGKFLNFNSKATVPTDYKYTPFQKVNIIYGENGTGKTTIATILKSLKGDNPLLKKKRSFNKSFAQEIQILTDTPTRLRSFSDNVWNEHYHDLEIFDIHFINENIYTGSEIQSSHKKNLFEVVIGLPGIKLKKDIQVIKERIQNGNKLLKATGEKIDIITENLFKRLNYCKLAVDPDIDSKIEAKKKQIETAKSGQRIIKTNELKPIPLLPYPYDIDLVEEILNKSIDSISTEYILRFNNHKTHYQIGENTEVWLKDGYEAIKEDELCPFCLTPLDKGSDIIVAYSQYFNVEYNDLLDSLNTIITTYKNYNIQGVILIIENAINDTNKLVEFWKLHITSDLEIKSLQEYQDELTELQKKCLEELNSKLLNPISYKSAILLKEFDALIKNINEHISSTNDNIDVFNIQITKLKETPAPDLLTFENDLKKLYVIKKRADDIVNDTCNSYVKYQDGLTDLNTKKDSLQKKLDEYSSNTFKDYAVKINHYLKAFAPCLQIKDLSSGYVGTSPDPMVKYALFIDNNEIKQEDHPSEPCFKFSLSEGDKSALALSFFLAKLELCENLNDTVIVFDDPVSSFDLHRKSSTINNFLTLSNRANQLFVLTHNLIFAAEFWKKAQVSGIPTCNQIIEYNNSSCLVSFEIKKETLLNVIKDSIALKRFINKGALEESERKAVARCIRPALESYLHLKFHDYFADGEWLGTFIDKIKIATEDLPYHRLNKNISELSEINDYSKQFHHREDDGIVSDSINSIELKQYCQRTLNFIQLI